MINNNKEIKVKKRKKNTLKRWTKYNSRKKWNVHGNSQNLMINYKPVFLGYGMFGFIKGWFIRGYLQQDCVCNFISTHLMLLVVMWN